MTQAKYKRMFKKTTKAVDFIQELKLDIQYLKAAMANGWYKNQKDKNEIKKLSKHNSKQALEIINTTNSIINKIQKVYQ